MKKFIRIVIPLVFLLFAFKADAAHLFFSPSSGSFYTDENFKVYVTLNSETSVNAIQGILNFPTQYLEVLAVYTEADNSIIDLWVQRPSFSNAGALGNVNFEGVVLNPGYLGTGGRIIGILFRVKKEGTATLNYTDFAILANDGLGTNVSSPNGIATFTLLPSRGGVSGLEGEEIQQVKAKIKSVEERVNVITGKGTGVLKFWNILPNWVKGVILIFIGITAIVLSLLVLGFGIILIIFFFTHSRRAWKKRKVIQEKIRKFFKKVKKSVRLILGFVGEAEEELKSDIKFTGKQLKRTFREAKDSIPLSKTIKDYFKSVIKIIKRFFTKNT